MARDEIESERDSLQQQAKSLKSELSRIQKEKDHVDKQKEKKEIELKAVNELYAAQTSKYDALKSQQAENERKCGELEGALTNEKHLCEQFRSELVVAEKAQKKLKKELEISADEWKRVDADGRSKDSLLEDVHKEKAKLQGEKDNLNKQLRDQSDKLSAQQNEYKQKLRECEEQLSAISTLKEKMNDLELSLATVSDQYNASREQGEQLRQHVQHLAAQDTVDSALSEENSSLLADIERLKTEINEKNITIRLQQQRVNDLTKTARELKSAEEQQQQNGLLRSESPSLRKNSSADGSKNASPSGSQKSLHRSLSRLSEAESHAPTDFQENVNFEYLRNVLLKFYAANSDEVMLEIVFWILV